MFFEGKRRELSPFWGYCIDTQAIELVGEEFGLSANTRLSLPTLLRRLGFPSSSPSQCKNRFGVDPVGKKRESHWMCLIFHVLKNIVLFSLVGFRGNLSLPDIFLVFPGAAKANGSHVHNTHHLPLSQPLAQLPARSSACMTCMGLAALRPIKP